MGSEMCIRDRFVSEQMIQRYYDEESTENLRASRRLLDVAAIGYTVHSLVGQIADVIANHAVRYESDLIYMGTHGRSAISGAFLGSVVVGVLQRRPCPVVVVP